MRATLTLAQHGNSVRMTFVPAILRWLKWGAGTEVQVIVQDEHHVQLVDTETFYREKFERERGAQQTAASATL